MVAEPSRNRKQERTMNVAAKQHDYSIPANADDSVTCECGHKIYDGEVVRSRCIKLHTGEALCRCKTWVKVPVAKKA